MLRSRPTKQQAAPSNNGSLSIHSTRRSNGGNNYDDPRGRRKSAIPTTSLIGTLIVASILFLVLLFSGSLSNINTSDINSSSSSSTSVEVVDNNNNNAPKVDGMNIIHDNNQQLRNAAAIQSNNNDNKSHSFKTTITSDTTGATSPTTGATLHIIFSTDCGTYQHWQSYLFFHRAYSIRQPGYITRIASGCTEKQLQDEKAWHEEHIAKVMSDRYRIHFTPHFSGVKDETTGEVKDDYKYFNKPFGLKHFLEHDELLGLVVESSGNNQMKQPNDIIILCDPDFALLRPITDDFSNPRETLVGPRRKTHFDEMSSHIVTHGHPYAQTYGLGTQWRKFNLDEIAGATSPAKEVDQKNGGLFYPAGPPYIGTASDMYKIAQAWSEFAPRVHREYPHLLAEMVSGMTGNIGTLSHCLLLYRSLISTSLTPSSLLSSSFPCSFSQYAYCIAAAHLQLPHTLIDSLMISSAGIGGEGWKFISDIPESETCSFASNPDHSIRPIPSLIHYCQRYVVDARYFWGKRKVPHGIFTCDHPLLEEPPMDLGQGVSHTEKDRMNAFMVCALTKFTNDAMMFFKDHHCEGGGNRERRELVPHVNLVRKKGG